MSIDSIAAVRASERRQRIVNVSADTAWQVVGRPELLHLWFPGIVDCKVEGTTRTITTGIGLALAEDILTNDPVQRRFQYRIAGGLFKEHLASIDVIALTPTSCVITYASDADPATMAIVLGGATAGALDELAQQLESGAGPAIDALNGGVTVSPQPLATEATT
ncbi:MAG: SRPBCC family protein [Actinomycetota bacterium]